MSTFVSVVIGVVSSLIATFLFLGLTQLTRRVLIPWVEDKIYRGIRIDGQWTDADLTADSKLKCIFELSQKADHVSGIYSHQDENPDSKATYRVVGEIRNTYLNASLWPLSDKLLDSATFLGRVFHKDGKLKMDGVLACVSSEDGKIVSHTISYVHKDS